MRDDRAFDLTIHSSWPLPGAQPATEPASLHIRQTSIPPFEPNEGPYALLDGALHFEAPGIARYRITPTQIDVDPTGHADEVTALLLSTALPAVLWMRGLIVLHAAAAILPGQTTATAIAGPSGSGKSSILRHLIAHGAIAVADDTLALTSDHTCSGLSGGTWVRDAGQSRFEAIAESRQAGSASLGRIVLLSPENLGRLTPTGALTALLNNLHRPLIPRILGLDRSLLPRLARLAAAVPVYSIHGDAENLMETMDVADDRLKGELRG